MPIYRLFSFSGKINHRQREEEQPRHNQNRDAQHRRHLRFPNLERNAHQLLKAIERLGRRARKTRGQRVAHNHLPEQQCAMRRREKLDDPLHPFRQLPDGDIDARHKADDGADDSAGNRERVVAPEKRNEEEHQRGIGKRREQNQPEDLE